MSLRSEIAEMFAALDGYERAELDLAAVGAWRLESLREHWREAKRRQRQGGADRARDRAGYAKRYATDEAFRERRRAYWRERSRRKYATDPAYRAKKLAVSNAWHAARKVAA